jgi:hypothetical protein
MVIHLVADEKLCTERIMIRAQNSGDQVRVDDNIESLRKRFATQQTECLPVIDYYKEKNKVHEVCCVILTQISYRATTTTTIATTTTTTTGTDRSNALIVSNQFTGDYDPIAWLIGLLFYAIARCLSYN